MDSAREWPQLTVVAFWLPAVVMDVRSSQFLLRTDSKSQLWNNSRALYGPVFYCRIC